MFYSDQDIIHLHLNYLRAMSTEQNIAFGAAALLILTIAVSVWLRDYVFKNKDTKCWLERSTSVIELVECIVMILGCCNVASVHSEDISSHVQHDYQVVYARKHYHKDHRSENTNIQLEKKLRSKFTKIGQKQHGHISPAQNRTYNSRHNKCMHRISKYNDRIVNDNVLRHQAVIDVKPTVNLKAIHDVACNPFRFPQPLYTGFRSLFYSGARMVKISNL